MAARKILILTNRIPYPMNDGGNLAMRAMIEGYHKAGWHVFLLAMNTSRHYITSEVLKTIYKDIAHFETVDINNDVKPIPTVVNYLFGKEPNHAVRFYKKAFATKIQEVIKSFQPDAIQVESIFLSGYLPLIKSLTKATTVLRLHNIEYEVWQRLAEETTQPLKKIYLRNLAARIKKYEEEAWGKYDLLVPITETDADVVRKTGIAKTHIQTIPFGIDVDEVNPSTVSESWTGYHIGAMDWLPNQEAMKWFLQDVWPGIYEANPGFKFKYAGRNMPDFFKKLEIEGVENRGEVPDANAFIADNKILIVPLRSGGGIRIKILEAMALGKVIVSTGIGIQGIDLIDEISFLRADDSQEFKSKISWILANKDKAVEIGQNAKELVNKKYNNHKLMQLLENKLIAIIQLKKK